MEYYDKYNASLEYSMRNVAYKYGCRECVSTTELLTWWYQEFIPPALTNEEKAYIENFIKPFKDRIFYIQKEPYNNKELLHFVLDDGLHDFYLPDFETNAQYINMKTNKKYSLKELGL